MSIKPTDPRLDELAAALQGIMATASMALKQLGQLRAEAVNMEEQRSTLPPMAGRTGRVSAASSKEG